MEAVYLVSAVRSAVGKGKKDGGLASVHPVELSAQVMHAAVQADGRWFIGCALLHHLSPDELRGLLT